MDLEIQLKIDAMTRFKRAKDRKLILNNPPQKETHLKNAKDAGNSSKIQYIFRKGVFGDVSPSLAESLDQQQRNC